MKRKPGYFKLSIRYYLGCTQEKMMALIFPLAHFLKHRKPAHKMTARQFERFRKYVNEQRKKR